jgi:hypothetical protein
MYAVGVGEMFDAINFHGPFKEFEDAADWAEKEVGMRSSWWVVQLEVPEQESPENDLILIENVDLKLLQQQYERLQEVVAFVEGIREHQNIANTPDASILDGVVEMLGDALPYPQTEEEARTCKHGNRVWFGHECGLCMDGIDDEYKDGWSGTERFD